MNSEIWLRSALSNPLLTIGLTGGGIMLGYVTTQWWAVAARYRFEAKRSRLELDLLHKKIEILNLKAQEAPESAWNGYRKFTVSRKVEECEDTYSFYLTPHNGRPLPPFKPGQYLTFELHPPNAAKPLVRCYSLSDGSLSNDHYRVTIKRALPPADEPGIPPGIVSSYFSDHVKEGDILNVKAPSGRFFLDTEVDRPVVLISGGIGITPMLAIARLLTHIKDNREIYFFFGCRNSVDHMFRDEVIELQKANPNMRLHICYSRPLGEDVRGEAYSHEGRVTVDLMKQILPSSNYEYYLCGPGPFMDTLVHGLYEWGVPKKDVKFEAFGPATVKSGPKEPKATSEPADQAVIPIEFARSGKTLQWDSEMENLLEFAEKNGITTIEGGCRAGSCGSCLVAIKQGEVEYILEPSAAPEDGSCLSCISRPRGKMVIDA
ncbi:MAG: 2Fe-2S iron-sulfur cluster-binding protein [Luteolibacter sp.]